MQKIKKNLSILIGLSIIVMLIVSYSRPTDINETLFNQYDSFDTYKKISTNPEVYRVAIEGDEIGYLAFGKSYGYQSDILVGAVIDDDGNVLETQILKQNETPSFIKKIYNADFLNRQFIGKPIEEGFGLSTNINAVSGATVSSRAITKAVSEASHTIASTYLEIQLPRTEEIEFGMNDIALIIMMILALLSYKLKNQKLRYLTMAYSIVILGFKFKQFIAYSWIVSLLLGKAPSFADNIGWYILMGGTLLFILLTGKNAYCTYICPFGALQEAGKRLSGFDFFKIAPKTSKRLRQLPGILAYITFAGAVLTEQMGLVSYEPFSLIFGRTGVGVQWILLPLVLIMSLFVMRFYCNYACPVGVVLNLSVKIRRFVLGIFKKKEETESEKVVA